MTAETDSQGRLHIPEELRERYGERFHLVTYEDRIALLPIADDPLAAVRDAAGDLNDASIEAIQADIDEAAKEEARDTDADR